MNALTSSLTASQMVHHRLHSNVSPNRQWYNRAALESSSPMIESRI
jgi:hypothetical protein